jgi:hypothetical protein
MKKTTNNTVEEGIAKLLYLKQHSAYLSAKD